MFINPLKYVRKCAKNYSKILKIDTPSFSVYTNVNTFFTLLSCCVAVEIKMVSMAKPSEQRSLMCFLALSQVAENIRKDKVSKRSDLTVFNTDVQNQFLETTSYSVN